MSVLLVVMFMCTPSLGKIVELHRVLKLPKTYDKYFVFVDHIHFL